MSCAPGLNPLAKSSSLIEKAAVPLRKVDEKDCTLLLCKVEYGADNTSDPSITLGMIPAVGYESTSPLPWLMSTPCDARSDT
jgi:hypothetical protein